MSSAQSLDSSIFPVPESLRPNVQFWISVYAHYGKDQAILHDERHLQVIYEIVDLADLNELDLSENELRRAREKRIQTSRDALVDGLRALAQGQKTETAEAQRLSALWAFAPSGRSKFSEAATVVRMQIGLRDRFSEAIVTSGLYMDGMEAALRREKVPAELSRLPFVESMFISRARSKVGAAGAWQFMPATARLHMRMSSAVDSRMDPFLAAAGAARLLRTDYEQLQSWPLAITAYNHGRAGVSRAVKRLGTRDLGEIVTQYQARRFGFASRNFYAEFIAAAEVYAQRKRYFPGQEPAEALQFDELRSSEFFLVQDLANTAGVPLDGLERLNPALDPDVFQGTLLVPRGYPLRVPQGTLAAFERALAEIPEDRKRTSQLQVGYRVRSGDTLGVLARRFGTTIGAIQRVNRLPTPNRIYVNQYLRIPGESRADFERRGSAPPGTARVARPGATNHVVQRGETLTAIAWQYGRSVEELVRVNGLDSADRLQAGERLRIPAVGESDRLASLSSPSQHIVRRGENLNRIASRYGVSVPELKRRNGLRSNLIYPGQSLVIPQ